MTSTLTGGAELEAFLANLVPNVERNVLRGALKAGADVIADAARDGCRSPEVRATIQTSARSQPGLVTAKIETKGDGAYKAPWLENGTDPHFISVDPEASGGRTAGRVNRLVRDGNTDVAASLVIGGKFVGDTVHHPGAKPYPFMRPAVDQHQDAAIEAISRHIAAKTTKDGITTPAPEEPDA